MADGYFQIPRKDTIRRSRYKRKNRQKDKKQMTEAETMETEMKIQGKGAEKMKEKKDILEETLQAIVPGDAAAATICKSDGTVLRSRCTALDGWRMASRVLRERSIRQRYGHAAKY